MRRATIISLLVVARAATCLGQQSDGVKIDLTIRDLPDELKRQERDIRENVTTAVEMWTKRVVTKPVTIEIELKFQSWVRGAGRSLTAVPLGDEKVNGRTLIEEGLPYELRTGNDPNGASPDVEIILDPEYARTIWWDPNPRSRTRPIPDNKLDGVSVIAHELGHAMGFNGRIDPKTGKFTGNEVSTYDRWVEFDGQDFFFNGPAAVKAYRKKIPLSKTLNNYHHFGEPGPRLDRKLDDALMNGIYFRYGKRYVVTPLDLVVLSDCGLEIRK
jgi:hypothetical protein